MLVVLDSPNSNNKVHVVTVSISLYHNLSNSVADNDTGDFER